MPGGKCGMVNGGCREGCVEDSLITSKVHHC